MTVSIIIAVKIWQANLAKCVKESLALDFSDFEIIILPDAAFKQGTLPAQAGGIPIRVIPTGPVGPAIKRDIAVGSAKGEILAFLDDDAYPRPDWLKNALKNFSDPIVAAVGGPAITPLEDNDKQKVSGAIFASFLVSGKFVYRYIPRPRREVEDYPSCNLLVRKSVMQQLGGFKTKFWPGEDTILCLEITKNLKQKIVYDPQVLIFHHRREVFLPHFKQISSYAMHRGYFVKKFPETSFKLPYFIPALFLIFVLSGMMFNYFSPALKMLYLAGLFTYLFLVFISSVFSGLKPVLISMVFAGIIFTHLIYGFYFLKGLMMTKLKEEH